MLKTALFVLAILSSATSGICGDLVLRVDTVGYEEAGSKVDEQESKLLRRIEVSVEPDKKFRARCDVGPEEMELSGFAHAMQDGRMNLTIQYRYAKFPPQIDKVPQNGDQRTPLSDTSVQTFAPLKVGVSTTIGGVASSRESTENSEKRYTRIEIVASLVEWENDAEPQP